MCACSWATNSARCGVYNDSALYGSTSGGVVSSAPRVPTTQALINLGRSLIMQPSPRAAVSSSGAWVVANVSASAMQSVDLMFTFDFFGQPMRRLYISEDGALHFRVMSGNCTALGARYLFVNPNG
jgi:hypothetical protein